MSHPSAAEGLTALSERSDVTIQLADRPVSALDRTVSSRSASLCRRYARPGSGAALEASLWRAGSGILRRSDAALPRRLPVSAIRSPRVQVWATSMKHYTP